MSFEPETTDKRVRRGTFRFLNVRIGTDMRHCIEIESAGTSHVTDLPGNTTEEELRAKMLLDGFIEVDRNGNPIRVLENILRNDQALAILEEATQKLKDIGIDALSQPLVSPVDHTVGWYLIVAKDKIDVRNLRALLAAGCDICGADHAEYARALDMISAVEN